MLKKIPIIVFALMLNAGCASMFTGTTGTVNVTSTPSDADCNVAGYGVHTPGNLFLPRQADDLTINCKKIGYEDGSSKIASSFNPTALVNILTGIGLAIGFVVDFATGAAWEYTDHVNVNLIKKEEA